MLNFCTDGTVLEGRALNPFCQTPNRNPVAVLLVAALGNNMNLKSRLAEASEHWLLLLIVAASYYGSGRISAAWAAATAAGYSDATVAFFLTGLWPFFVYLAYSAILYVIDIHGSADWRARYKVQPRLVSRADYARVFALTLPNWILIGIPYAALLAWYIMPAVGAAIGASGFPPLQLYVRDLVLYVLVEEVAFFSTHYLLHKPYFYSRIHKIHHEYTAPFGSAAVYAHPVEHVLSNVVPVSLGPLLCGSHPFTAAVWSTVAIINTMTSHSGYHFAGIGMQNPYFHDWHHQFFNECFGVLGVLDALCGTSTRFLEAERQGKLHVPRLPQKEQQQEEKKVAVPASAEKSSSSRKRSASSSSSKRGSSKSPKAATE